LPRTRTSLGTTKTALRIIIGCKNIDD